MKVYKVDLYEHFGIKKPDQAKGILTCFVNEEGDKINGVRKYPAMVVIPGGGYRYCSNREGLPIALAYLNEGFNAFVLEYTCDTSRYPTQLIEGCMAVAYAREKADEHFTDENKVCAIGFSAGGHLCGMLATIFDEKVVKDVLGDRNVRPDRVILSYPVISSGDKAHKGSFDYLCGDNEQLKKDLSLEFRVKENSVPAFIWSTYEDTCVPCENSFLLANEYRKANIPFEFHLFEHGVHGLSLGTKLTAPNYDYIKPWFQMSINWLRSHDIDLNV